MPPNSSAAPSRWSASFPSCRPSAGSTTAAASRPATRRPACIPSQQHLHGRRAAARRHRNATTRWRANCASRCSRSPAAAANRRAVLQLHIPLFDQGLFAGVVLGEFSDRRPAALRHARRRSRRATRSRCSTPRAADRRQHRQPARGRARACCPGRAHQRVRGAGVAGRQRPAAARAGLPHLAGPGRQRPVLAGGGAERADQLDADRHLAPHAPAPAGAAGAGGRDQLPPRDGELDAHRHARARPGRPHHLRQRRLLRR